MLGIYVASVTSLSRAGEVPTGTSIVVAFGTVAVNVCPNAGSVARGYLCSVWKLSLEHLKLNEALAIVTFPPPATPCAPANVRVRTPVLAS